MSALKQRLPARGEVGYVTDLSGDEGDRSFYLAQYTLSPLIVERTTQAELVVGNFKDPVLASEIAIRNDLILVENFGQGIFLFRKP